MPVSDNCLPSALDFRPATRPNTTAGKSPKVFNTRNADPVYMERGAAEISAPGEKRLSFPFSEGKFARRRPIQPNWSGHAHEPAAWHLQGNRPAYSPASFIAAWYLSARPRPRRHAGRSPTSPAWRAR